MPMPPRRPDHSRSSQASGPRGHDPREAAPRRPGQRGAGPRGPGPRPAVVQAPELARIAGLPAVDAVFETAAEHVERLYFEPGMRRAVATFTADLARRQKPFREVEAEELARIGGTQMHGGVVALVRLDAVAGLHANDLATWARQGEPLLALDGVGNPQNIGAIARTAAFFGLPRVLISDHPAQAGLSDASFRIAKGGLSYVRVVRASNLATVLKRAQAHYRVIGTALGAGVALDRVGLDRRPNLVVLGNEEIGLPPATLAACELVVTLPATGRVQSLNVSVTAGIVIHALLAGHRHEG